MGYLESGLEELLLFLEKEKDFYNNLIDPSLQGTLNSVKRGKGQSYLHCVPVRKNGHEIVYSRKAINKHPDVIRALATNAFAREAIKISENNIRQLRFAQGKVMELTPESVMSKLKSAYRELPAKYYSHITDEGFMEKYREWIKAPFTQSNYKPEAKTCNTGRGLLVRSRAEMMLVEKFYQHGVPFRYEEVMVIDGFDLAPDFTFPSKVGRKFYLEYCGMMDDQSYVDRFLWKRRLYEKAGITEWENMIYLFDSNNELDMSKVDHIIKALILPRL